MKSRLRATGMNAFDRRRSGEVAALADELSKPLEAPEVETMVALDTVVRQSAQDCVCTVFVLHVLLRPNAWCNLVYARIVVRRSRLMCSRPSRRKPAKGSRLSLTARITKVLRSLRSSSSKFFGMPSSCPELSGDRWPGMENRWGAGTDVDCDSG